MPRSTINDVAKLAGVSATSVSLAFKNSPRVSDRTRERIFAAAGELKYTPNQAARQLRSGKTDLVGFIVPDLCNPFHAAMIKQAESVLNARGFSLLVCNSNWSAGREYAIAQQLLQMRAVGVLICASEKDMRCFELFDSARIPCVALDTVPAEYNGFCVINDLAALGRSAAEHLMDIGARRMLYADASIEQYSFSAFKTLRQSFEKTLKKAGCSCQNVPGGMNIEQGRSAFNLTRQRQLFFDGVLCVNDLCALGFMDEASQHGLNAGRDFALAGIDNIPAASLSGISLTSLRQPHDEIIRTAVEILAELIRCGSTTLPHRTVFAPELLKRKTTLDFKTVNLIEKGE